MAIIKKESKVSERLSYEKEENTYLSISMITENNCLEFSNNKLIQILTKFIIFKRGTLKEKLESIKEDPRFKNYDNSLLLNIFKKLINTLNARKTKVNLNPDEKKFAYHIALNLITKKGKLNRNEVLKIIKTKLFLNTSNLDSEIFKIINSVKERVIVLDKFSIPKYLLPKKSSMYLIEKNKNFLLGLGPKYLHINSHILFFNKTKIFGLGIIHSINKEGIINNTYKILPLVIITNDNFVHIEDLSECEFPIKNIPFSVITAEENENIISQLIGVKDFISLGARLVGNQVVKKTSNSILWYNLNYESLLDMFEKRLVIYGTPSSGKSILGIQILRYIGNKKRKVIAIAPNNPNLAKFGLPLKNIGPSNPKWDLENIGVKYLNKYGNSKLENYTLITLGEDFFMPDIENLSKKTILSLINEVTGSVQIKNIIALEMVDYNILEILKMAADETLLKQEDFQQNQIKALKRVAKILLKWQKIGNKINLKEKIFSNEILSLGFFIDSNLFLPELVYILMAEIFYNSKPCFDIKQDGLFLMIDEVPLLMSEEGVLIKGKHLGRIFAQINKQGRNMGILLSCIIQDYNKKIQNYFLPNSLEEYCIFHLNVKNKRRVIKINKEFILIPPVTNI